MEFLLLGAVEALRNGRRVALGGSRQQTVLAVLAMSTGTVVSLDRLVDAVWGEEPPATARQQVYSSISALRRALGDVVLTGPGGYQLAVDAGCIDLGRFDIAVADARRTAGSSSGISPPAT